MSPVSVTTLFIAFYPPCDPSNAFLQVEYEEEEIQVKEVEKEFSTEISMPQVKTLYKYNGQGMGFEKGEVSGLCLAVCLITYSVCVYLFPGVPPGVQDQQRLVVSKVSAFIQFLLLVQFVTITINYSVKFFPLSTYFHKFSPG